MNRVIYSVNSVFFSSPSVVLACVCMHTCMHCLYTREYMAVFMKNILCNLVYNSHSLHQFTFATLNIFVIGYYNVYTILNNFIMNTSYSD